MNVARAKMFLCGLDKRLMLFGLGLKWHDLQILLSLLAGHSKYLTTMCVHINHYVQLVGKRRKHLLIS